MGLRSYVKSTVKDNTNVKGWASWGTIKEVGQNIGTFLKVEKRDAPKKETFEEAIKRFGFSEADIVRRAQSHFKVALFCGCLGAVAIVLMIYLFMKTMLLSSLVALSVAILMFSYAFREHFYYFQMKQRRLDCTVSEWFSNLLGRERKNV